MYEGITYAELKSLPKDQKSNAWRELKALYSTQKELAEKLGVSPAIVYNMISRYAREETKGAGEENKLDIAEPPKRNRTKGKRRAAAENRGQDMETPGAEPERPVIVSEIAAPEAADTVNGAGAETGTGAAAGIGVSTGTSIEIGAGSGTSAKNGTETEAATATETGSGTFSILINKSVSGEEAQIFLNGIGSTLLRNQIYSVEIKISEK